MENKKNNQNKDRKKSRSEKDNKKATKEDNIRIYSEKNFRKSFRKANDIIISMREDDEER